MPIGFSLLRVLEKEAAEHDKAAAKKDIEAEVGGREKRRGGGRRQPDVRCLSAGVEKRRRKDGRV